jgi:hypothetical protein
VKGVLDASLLLLHLRLSGGADLDDSDTTDELGETLLQLLTVVVAARFGDLSADLLDAGVDVGLFAAAVDDRGVVLVNFDSLGAPEILDRQVLELEAKILGNRLTAGEDRKVP